VFGLQLSIPEISTGLPEIKAVSRVLYAFFIFRLLSSVRSPGLILIHIVLFDVLPLQVPKMRTQAAAGGYTPARVTVPFTNTLA
jgi:hypothetical protein